MRRLRNTGGNSLTDVIKECILSIDVDASKLRYIITSDGIKDLENNFDNVFLIDGGNQ